MKKNKSKSVPLAVLAGIQSLLDLIPDRYKKGTNEMIGVSNSNSTTYKKLQAYRKMFPPGTVGFTFPRCNKTMPPDYYYNQLEGRTVYFVAWELNIPGWEPTCFECNHKMVRDSYDYQTHGYAIPVFDISGVTNYYCSMQYNCTNCRNRCKASDGRILIQLPPQYRNGFDVDPRYCANKERYLSRSFTRVMDKMFITHGNSDQLSNMLHELRGDQYLDMEEEYYTQAIASGVEVTKKLPSFEQFIGRYSHSGEQLRTIKDEASTSELLFTGVSDKDQCCRELQSVGCTLTSASNHTFKLIKNYVEGLLPKTACAHTIGSNTGKIASIAIAKDTSQREYAHQAEQCTLRGGWNP